MRHSIKSAILVATMIFACSEAPTDLTPVAFDNSQRISVTLEDDSILADGVTRGKISLRTPNRALFGKDVTLTITPVGILKDDAGNGETTSTTVKISETGTATAYVTSATTGVATIKVTVEGATATADVTFYAPEVSLSVELDSLPIDNTFSRVTVTAEPAWKGRNVVFTIAPQGVLRNPANPASTAATLTLPLSEAGETSVYVSSNTTGTSYLRAEVEGRILTHVIRFYSRSPFTINLTNDGLIADNYSVATLAASADPTIMTGKTVTFTTDNGTFSNGQPSYTANPDVDGTAKAYLKSTRAVPARVTMTLPDNVTREQIVTFTPAPPTHVFVESAVSTLPSELTSKTTVTARLERTLGFPSENQIVTFSDSTEVNTSIGTFLNVTTSGTSRQATAQYWIQNSAYTGFVYIKACVTRTDGTTVCGKNRILVE